MNMITQIVAVDRRGMIAREDFNGILWKCRSDMKRFKKETSGHNIIMGRTTFDSIGIALPKRVNIVLTRNATWDAPEGVKIAHSKAAALAQCDPEKDIFIIGGAEIYSLFEDVTTEVHFTEIALDANGDVPYPVDLSQFEAYQQEFHEKGEKDDASQVVRRYSIRNSVG